MTTSFGRLRRRQWIVQRPRYVLSVVTFLVAGSIGFAFGMILMDPVFNESPAFDLSATLLASLFFGPVVALVWVVPIAILALLAEIVRAMGRSVWLTATAAAAMGAMLVPAYMLLVDHQFMDSPSDLTLYGVAGVLAGLFGVVGVYLLTLISED